MDEFVQKEMACGAVHGPMSTPPFKEWTHILPMMSRPKSDPAKRRVILDLSYPPQNSVIAFIKKNTVLGQTRGHTLPTVDLLLKDVAEVGKGAYLFTIDVERAYKNFRMCPLNWPLLAFQWKDQYYFETSMPFGSHASLMHMQRVVQAITSILRRRGLRAHMYLDDLVVVAESAEKAWWAYGQALQLFDDLGLPEARDKRQPPAWDIVWLGVRINTEDMTISMPEDKVAATLEAITNMRTRKTTSVKTLQSVLSKILHMSKCVQPARLFVGRLLQALREAMGLHMKISQDMRKDLDWFIQFLKDWNGVALINTGTPSREIVADACPRGFRVANGERCYSAEVPQDIQEAHISALEAMNVLVAVNTFTDDHDAGRVIRIRCDNSAAVNVFTTGRARDPYLMACARAMWMLQATCQFKLVFVHTPGVEMTVADSLSRAPFDQGAKRRAEFIMEINSLKLHQPDFGILYGLSCV